MQQLSLSFRPKTFDDLVGQKQVIERIRGLLEKRHQTAWMFTGETGSGKTTLARILALSYQCKHQKEFGSPCRKCYKHRHSFDIEEINASKDTGKERMEKLLYAVDYYPKHGSKYKVYILDEFQKLSENTQDMLLKLLEESPKTTIYILCTSRPEEVIRAMWRRVKSIGLLPLNEEGIKELIKKLIDFTKTSSEELSVTQMTETLLENSITSSGFVVKAVESKLAGASYEEASVVEFTSSFNPKYLVRSITHGDWDGTRKLLSEATKEDARAIRASVSAYLSTILVESETLDDRTEAVAKAIEKITDATGENSVILARVRASCFYLCRIFKKHSR